MTDNEPAVISLRDESIRLGQLLKLASLVEDGVEAKSVIEDGHVLVNGEVETRRGRQVRNGDTVEVAGERIVVAAETDAAE
ncbi:RNA-binding S4 domain-containing protein [Zhihengliuella alba]|uniref:RNA-binding S4 domain-containing protein n=1 Tax=Zhihengliuella alba TaxID=547018 RepID=A0ABP7D8V0_9MICC